MVFNMIGAPSGGYSGYQIDQSMVLDGSSDYLSWTPGSTQGDDSFGFRIMLKRHALGSQQIIYDADPAGVGNDNRIQFRSGDVILVTVNGSAIFTSSALFRDVSSFYDFYFRKNGTTFELYQNGTLLESNTCAANASGFNVSGVVQAIGSTSAGGSYLNATIAECYMIAGTAPAVTDFGEFNSDNIWSPKAVSGLTYGTNGFYLPFTQDSPNLGVDYSGNGNDWTENGSPVQSSDSPTVNYATWNPLDTNYSTSYIQALTQGNKYLDANTTVGQCHLTMPIPKNSGVWYWEMQCHAGTRLTCGVRAIGDQTTTAKFASTAGSQATYWTSWTGDFGYNSSSVGTNSTWGATDILGFELDSDTGVLSVTLNGVAQTYTATITHDGPYLFFAANESATGGGGEFELFIDEDELNYSLPTGAKTLSAANLPEVTITDPGEYFNVVGYTGNNGSNSITGVGFQPDLVWMKNRDDGADHQLHDAVRGYQYDLRTNSTAAESDQSANFTSFDSDGFSLAGISNRYNDSPEDYISWNWKAGGAGVPNTDGTISSTVSVNDDAGFSIVSYTGTGSAATVGHGQSSAPEMIIVKNRDIVSNWITYHHLVASDPETDYLLLNSTAAVTDNASTWNDTAPTATTFSVGISSNTNGSTNDLVAYCFRSIPGYSKVFSYTGNGSTDGTFVYLGFKPRWVMIKRTDASADWQILDSERSPNNAGTLTLEPNTGLAEQAYGSGGYDLLSNGFKPREGGSTINASGGTYIGIAFAENPFGGSNLPLGLAA